MSGICGYFGLKDDSGKNMEAMASALRDEIRTSGGARSAIAAGKSGSVFSMRSVLAAIFGKPEFRDAKLQALAETEGMAHALAQGYLEHREDIFGRISGAFSAAILDENDGSAYLAIDRSGICPLIYTVKDNVLVFGSTLGAINRHPIIKPELNHQAIYDYVYFHMIPGPESIYLGQYHLLPGEYLSFKNGNAKVDTYWKMHFIEQEKAPFEVLKAEFLSTLLQSVEHCARGANTGAFLSGGTDSSTLAGMLGEVTGKAAPTYSIGFEAEGYDEMEYARIASKHFGTRHHEYYVTPGDVAKAIPEIASVYDQPFGNASAMPAYYCAKLAKEDGIERLLGGDGGDELFGGNARYAKQRVFSIYDSIPAPLRHRAIEPLSSLIPDNSRLTLLRKAKSYVDQASVAMPGRLETYNLLERLGPANVFSPEFLSQIDTGNPLKLLEKTYNGAEAKTQLNRMLALDLKFTLADNDLPKVVKTCELAGIDVAFPMLDDRVVAFSARLAPGLKLKGTRLRYFFKEALRGYLPDAILTKSKHGFGLPFGEWLKTDKELQELAQESLDSLKSRGIFRPEFIDELTKLHAENHSSYYGTLIWVLVMLEQWFIQHR
jgi:asparagine synthase (glutamine-hydrolysing)